MKGIRVVLLVVISLSRCKTHFQLARLTMSTDDGFWCVQQVTTNFNVTVGRLIFFPSLVLCRCSSSLTNKCD